MAKILTAFFSMKGETYANGKIIDLAKGYTQIAAEYIQKAIGGDLFRIEQMRTYSTDHMKMIQEAKAELESDERPELKRYLDSIADYDNVFVCGPCWWGTYPCAVFTQLEKLDWHGKKVMALMTHEGSGLGGCERDLKRICEGASFGKGLAVHSADASRSESTVASWAKAQV